MKINRKNNHNDAIEVSMSPLIDCVFLLLIFFLVTTMIKKKDKSADINLPTSNTAIQVPISDDTVLGINQKGRFYLNGTVVDRMRLRRYLSKLPKDTGIRLDIDHKAKFKHVAELREMCMFYQFKKIAIRTHQNEQ